MKNVAFYKWIPIILCIGYYWWVEMSQKFVQQQSDLVNK